MGVDPITIGLSAGAAGYSGYQGYKTQKEYKKQSEEAMRQQQQAMARAQATKPEADTGGGLLATARKNLARRKKLTEQGRRSTISTSPLGYTGQASVGYKTLLGG